MVYGTVPESAELPQLVAQTVEHWPRNLALAGSIHVQGSSSVLFQALPVLDPCFYSLCDVCVSFIYSSWIVICILCAMYVCVFHNTSQLEGEGGREGNSSGGRVWNKAEVEIVTRIVSTLLQVSSEYT